MMTLVDVPRSRVTVTQSAAWRDARAPSFVRRLAIGTVIRHLRSRGARQLRRAPIDAGAKSVVRAHEAEIVVRWMTKGA
jgi:hypothetical protein